MNRRGFLGLIGAAATGLVLPEPRRVYSFPSEAVLLAKFKADLEAEIYAALMTAPKMPYTPAGIELIKHVVKQKVYEHTDIVLSIGGRLFIPGPVPLLGSLDGVTIRGKVEV